MFSYTPGVSVGSRHMVLNLTPPPSKVEIIDRRLEKSVNSIHLQPPHSTYIHARPRAHTHKHTHTHLRTHTHARAYTHTHTNVFKRWHLDDKGTWRQRYTVSLVFGRGAGTAAALWRCGYCLSECHHLLFD